MKKFIMICIPIGLLGVFIAIMLSGLYLKKPLNEMDNVPGYIELVAENIKNENWEVARDDAEKLDVAWKKVIKRIQYSSEIDQIVPLSLSISRVKGAIEAKDKSIGLVEISEVYEHWNQIGK